MKDNVYQIGSPFKDDKEMLHVSVIIEFNINIIQITKIEAIGFGDEENLNDLSKKQARESKITLKMRQVDKTQFMERFDTEIFFGKFSCLQ